MSWKDCWKGYEARFLGIQGVRDRIVAVYDMCHGIVTIWTRGVEM